MPVRVNVPMHIVIDPETATSHLDHVETALTGAASRALLSARATVEKTYGVVAFVHDVREADRQLELYRALEDPWLFQRWQDVQLAQLKKFLRAAAEHSNEVDVIIHTHGRRLAIPLADGSFEYIDVLDSLHYNIATTVPPGFLDLTITIGPDGAWRVTHNLPSGTPGADVPLSGTR